MVVCSQFPYWRRVYTTPRDGEQAGWTTERCGSVQAQPGLAAWRDAATGVGPAAEGQAVAPCASTQTQPAAEADCEPDDCRLRGGGWLCARLWRQ